MGSQLPSPSVCSTYSSISSSFCSSSCVFSENHFLGGKNPETFPFLCIINELLYRFWDLASRIQDFSHFVLHTQYFERCKVMILLSTVWMEFNQPSLGCPSTIWCSGLTPAEKRGAAFQMLGGVPPSPLPRLPHLILLATKAWAAVSRDTGCRQGVRRKRWIAGWGWG